MKVKQGSSIEPCKGTHRKLFSIPPMKNRPSKNAHFKNRSSERVRLKSDQLLFLYIAVDSLFRRILSPDRFLKHALPLDRSLFGEIGLLSKMHPEQTSALALGVLVRRFR